MAKALFSAYVLGKRVLKTWGRVHFSTNQSTTNLGRPFCSFTFPFLGLKMAKICCFSFQKARKVGRKRGLLHIFFPFLKMSGLRPERPCTGVSGPSGPKSPKSLQKVSKRVEKSQKSVQKRLFRDFFETFRLFSRLYGHSGLGGPGDFFETFWGFWARRAQRLL